MSVSKALFCANQKNQVPLCSLIKPSAHISCGDKNEDRTSHWTNQKSWCTRSEQKSNMASVIQIKVTCVSVHLGHSQRGKGSFLLMYPGWEEQLLTPSSSTSLEVSSVSNEWKDAAQHTRNTYFLCLVKDDCPNTLLGLTHHANENPEDFLNSLPKDWGITEWVCHTWHTELSDHLEKWYIMRYEVCHSFRQLSCYLDNNFLLFTYFNKLRS